VLAFAPHHLRHFFGVTDLQPQKMLTAPEESIRSFISTIQAVRILGIRAGELGSTTTIDPEPVAPAAVCRVIEPDKSAG
jgi:hypothetical protein